MGEARSPLVWFRALEASVGRPLLTYLGVAYAMKGAVGTILFLSTLPYFRGMGVSGDRMQAISVITALPWSVKGVWGIVSDSWAPLGWRKRTMQLAALAVSAPAVAALALWRAPGAAVGALLFTLGQLGVSVTDLLCEGRYGAAMRERPETGTSMVTYAWLIGSASSLVGCLAVGPLSDAGLGAVLYGAAALIMAAVAVPAAAGCIQEGRVPEGQRGFDWAKARRHSRVYVAALSAAAAAALSALFTLVAPAWLILGASAVCAAGVAAAIYWALGPAMAAPVVYLFITSASYVNVSGALDYWYVAGPECVPGGPHFTYTFYSGVGPVVSTAVGLLAVAAFQRFMSSWPVRRVFWVAISARVVAASVDIAVVKRWNVSAGVPDGVMFLAGVGVVQQVAAMLEFMPAIVLTARLCTPGLESTTFAMIAAYQNFGRSVAGSLGIVAMRAAGVVTVGDCDFDALPWLIGICHMILPLAAIPLTFVMLPSIRMDRLEPEGEEEERDVDIVPEFNTDEGIDAEECVELIAERRSAIPDHHEGDT